MPEFESHSWHHRSLCSDFSLIASPRLNTHGDRLAPMFSRLEGAHEQKPTSCQLHTDNAKPLYSSPLTMTEGVRHVWVQKG